MNTNIITYENYILLLNYMSLSHFYAFAGLSDTKSALDIARIELSKRDVPESWVQLAHDVAIGEVEMGEDKTLLDVLERELGVELG